MTPVAPASNVVPYVKREKRYCDGPNCIVQVRRKHSHSDTKPVFCSYACGVKAQPSAVQATLRNSSDDRAN